MELCRMRLLRLWRHPPPPPATQDLHPCPLTGEFNATLYPTVFFGRIVQMSHFLHITKIAMGVVEGEGGREVMGAPSLPQRPGNITSRPACSVLDDKASRANGSNLIKHLPVFYNSIAPKSTYWGIHTFSMKSILPLPYKT